MTHPTTPPYMATFTLLIEGTVRHEYGDGSCLSCGGEVLSIADKVGKLHEACACCGLVEPAVFFTDTGAPVQGFLSLAESKQLSVLRDDPDAAIPF